MPSSTTSAASGLIKNHLSDELRSEILNGSLKPGECIVEEKSLAGTLQATANSGTRATFHFTLPIEVTESSALGCVKH